MRLSIINFAGTARTDVAVGTLSDPSMLATTRPATPRSGSTVASSGDAKTGAGLTTACAGVGCDVVDAAGVTTCCVAIGVCAAGATGVAGAAGAACATGVCTGVAGAAGVTAA
ncbi:unannotated protein [freshwater metagenome]|uniref:Unannotated protein n=1 Tax=freshwater metagenome TaxID=449393 RepID=A0A6J6KI99_9ZZZZ